MSEHRSSSLQAIQPFVITHASPARPLAAATSNNYLYKSQEFTTALADDAKSNRSVMTTKSTREVFDLLGQSRRCAVMYGDMNV